MLIKDFNATYSAANRPTQTEKREFLEYDHYDFTIPWSVFKISDDELPTSKIAAQFNSELPPQNFEVKSGDNVYFVDIYAECDGDGSFEKPYTDIYRAVDSLKAGDTLYIRGGVYNISKPVFIVGKEGGEQGITISSYGKEMAIFDCHDYDTGSEGFNTENGIFTIDRCSDILVQNIGFRNSHCKGVSIFNSNRIEILHCRVHNTFACGISIWDTNPIPEKTNAYRGFKIFGNTITKATTWDMIPFGRKMRGEPPHEAISIAGATDFEIAFNHLDDCDKEGIDVKENSKNGRVHHNYVHDCARQGLYADAWFGTLSNVTFDRNIVYRNRGAGLALSVEGRGSYLSDVTFEKNIVYKSHGTGFFTSRWGHDLPRENILVKNNTFVHNGHGPENGPDEIFWITGGMHFFSANVKNMVVENNIFSDNATFEIGCCERYGTCEEEIRKSLEEKNIVIRNNLIDYRDNTTFPVTIGWVDNYADVRPYSGDDAVIGAPEFADIEKCDFTPVGKLAGKNIGAL